MSEYEEEIVEDFVEQFDYDFEKIFSFKSDSLKLKDQLATLRKKDLTEIRKNLNIEGVSQFNKDELIVKLSNAIPEYLAKIIPFLAKTNYHFLNHVINSGQKKFVIDAEQINVEELDLGAFLFSYGIAYPALVEEGLLFIFPDEIYAVLKVSLKNSKIKEQIETNQDLLLKSWAMLNFYGVMETHTLYEKLTEYTKIEVGADHFNNVLYLNSNYHNILQEAGGIMALDQVMDIEFIYNEQMARDLDYADIPQADYDKLIEKGSIIFNFAQKRLQKYLLKNYDLESKEARALVHYISSLIQNGLKKSVISDELFSIIGKDKQGSTAEIGQLLVDINNQSRLWFLKGHRPEDLVKN
ncbi:hypothetical protein [Halanaerobium hydrogeniformans]|uniref:Rho termination factor N-terminal domain-containing protein n=1 Tax=Halanaerobium hydrogeniformans TaxID=656519 RepID=E4RL68_HALHG|nr:hypothetical protein [Halanaerobium hydrogeniformans]ADQ15749.1 hypothetical protein Halsa_2345 [Halanaerobium hydrogeniformans]